MQTKYCYDKRKKNEYVTPYLSAIFNYSSYNRTVLAHREIVILCEISEIIIGILRRESIILCIAATLITISKQLCEYSTNIILFMKLALALDDANWLLHSNYLKLFVDCNMCSEHLTPYAIPLLQHIENT